MNFRLLWRAVRPFAYPASATPVAFGAVLALWRQGGPFHWLRFAAAMIGGIFIHTGGNLLNDYYDFKSGLDREGSHGSSGVLVEGLMKPSQVLRLGLIAFAGAVGIGVYLFFVCGWPILAFGVFGVASAAVYTAAPVSLKYRALGDVQVPLTFGVAMVTGAYFVQSGRLEWLPVAASVPLALLIDAILHVNNLRDIEHDRAGGIKTLAMLLGARRSQTFYLFLIFGAYAWVAGMVVLRAMPPLVLVVFVTLPLALHLLRTFWKATAEGGAAMEGLDAKTAQLNLVFGIVLTLSILAHHVWFQPS